MKHRLLYLLLSLMALNLGCKKLTYVPPPAQPVGTFSGKFAYLHRNIDNLPYDTLQANVTLKLTSTDGTFKVTGDTSTVHAGSFGTYAISSSTFVFTDKTMPPVGTPVKKHLSGVYNYSYDGYSLKILAYSSDTLRYEYDLSKTTN